MTFPPEVWTGVLRRLHEELPDFTYEAWIAPLKLGEAHADRVVVLCPTTFHRDRVRHTLQKPIAAALSEETGARPMLDFDVAAQLPEKVDPPPSFEMDAAQAPASPEHGVQALLDPQAQSLLDAQARPLVDAPARPLVEAHPRPPRSKGKSQRARDSVAGARSDASTLADALARTTAGLRVQPAPDATAGQSASGARAVRAAKTPGDARRTRRAAPGGRAEPQQAGLPYAHSFDNFVVGPCNALAREAAFAVAGGQQMPLKQLYLASPPGLGKTHLARAVAAAVAQQQRRPVRYANAEAFTSEFVSALRSKTTTEFKRRYRPERGGLLVVEDVQFLAAKRATQLEFFHSVQHVLDAGGRVLLTGDRMPQEMTDLDERVREQLAGGFVAGLEPPDAVVRRSILKTKAAHGGIALPDDCLDLLVESATGNVRELESVLMQVVTTSTLLKRPIDRALTERAIAQKVQPVAPAARRPAIDDVLGVVAAFFKTTPEMLAARSRKRAVLVPRQLAMYLCHRHTDASLADIGRALDRDHPSVRNAIKKVEREMLESPRLRYQVEALTTRIQERVG